MVGGKLVHPSPAGSWIKSHRPAFAAAAVDLVDELHLMVFPVVLGSGKRLFADSAAVISLKLVETKQSGSVAILTLGRTG